MSRYIFALIIFTLNFSIHNISVANYDLSLKAYNNKKWQLAFSECKNMFNAISEELIIEISSLAEEAIGESIVIAVDDKILEKGILDSPAIIKLILFIEKKYKVIIEEDEMNIDSFSSINQIEKLIKSKIG